MIFWPSQASITRDEGSASRYCSYRVNAGFEASFREVVVEVVVVVVEEEGWVVLVMGNWGPRMGDTDSGEGVRKAWLFVEITATPTIAARKDCGRTVGVMVKKRRELMKAIQILVIATWKYLKYQSASNCSILFPTAN